jgi:predicted PhzF superfamily epimerase YddE/YHI9
VIVLNECNQHPSCQRDDPEQNVHIQQGVEMKRRSQILVRMGRDGELVRCVRVGGHAVEIIESEVSL